MGLNALGLGLTFTAKDLASPTMAKVRGNLNRTSQSADLMGRNVAKSMSGAKLAIAGAVSMAGVAGIALGVKAAKAFGAFEQGIAKVGAISRASEADLKLLKDAAIKAGIETQFTPTEATEGLANLAQAGFNAKESIDLLNPTLNLAAGGQISMAQSSATVSAAVKVFALSGEEAINVADKLLRVSNATALSAGDLEIALGNVARGAGVAQQSINEMLPSIGMVKNTGVDASVAASSVSSALLQMAQNTKKFDAIGVAITNADGTFRPFLDVIQETQVALSKKYTNAAERAAAATDLFGRFGLTAFSAIGGQLNDGIKDASGNIVKGAEAIAFLRSEMVNAKGTADEFKNKLLDTFEGQKTLLRGSLETLAIVVGEPLVKAMRPFVEGITGAINAVITFLQKVPAPVKEFAAKLFIVGSAAMTIVGGIASAKLAMAALGVTAKVVGVALLAALKPLLILGAIVAVGVGVFKLFRNAYEENLGGFADFLDGVVSKARLIWDGLAQVFRDGVLTGAVKDELLKAENAGLLNFVTKVASFVERVRAFFTGLSEGFHEAMNAAGPSIAAFVDALKQLGAALGFLGDKPGDLAAGFESAGNTGFRFGEAIGKVLTFLVDTVTLAIHVMTGFAKGWDMISAAVAPITAAFGTVFDAIEQVVIQIGLGTGAGQGMAGVFQFVGEAIAAAISLAAAVFGGRIGGMVTQILGAMNVFSGVVKIIKGIFTGDWGQIWAGAKQVFFGFVQSVLGMLETLVGGIAGLVDAIGQVFGAKFDFKGTIADVRKSIEKSLAEGMDVPAIGGLEKATTAVAPPTVPDAAALAGGPSPTVFAAAGEKVMAEMSPSSAAAMAKAAAAAAAAAPAPVTKATLNVDGQKLADLVAKHEREGSAGDVDVDVE